MKLHRVIASSLCLGAAGVAHAQDPTSDLVGTWELEYATEACTDVTTTQSWTFSSDGSFRREVDGKSVVGSWSLAEEGRELHLSLTDGGSETHVIVVLDGRRLELLTPTQVAKGIVLQQERFAAFYHS
jgi:hypothetical protein